jgi:phosphomannomutase
MPPQPTAGELRFGSDGYRGVIGDTFCWEQVARLTAGVAQYLKLRGVSRAQPIPIGYDTRFLAQHYARAVYLALESEGFTPKLTSTFCPSPYLSFAVKRMNAPLGIMLTASHNPARYLGFKLKGPEGGSALPELNREVEQYAAEASPDYDPSPAFSAIGYGQFDLRHEYEATMLSYAGSALAKYPFNLSIDFVYGTAAHLYLQVLNAAGVKFAPIHTERDPRFGGGKPEPIPSQLEELVGWAESGGPTSFGAAFDGDGDRLGLIDEHGEFVPPEDIFAICLLHLVEDRGLRGRVVKSVSFSTLIDRICAALSLKLVEVPVGFKHSTRELLLPNTLMAAEESGGFGFGFHLPERDALLALLIVLSAMAARKSSLRALRDGIAKRFGHPCFAREDIALAGDEQAAAVREKIARVKLAPELIGLEGARLSEMDGVKLTFAEGFILLRFSGTEPLVRIYCEHAVQDSEHALIARVKEFLGL